MSAEVECLIDARRLVTRISELGREISDDYAAVDTPIVVGVLTGAWVFMADLVRRLSVPVACDFIRLSSYGQGSSTSGSITIETEPRLDFDGRHVLIVEDIADTGTSIAWLRDYFGRKAASHRVCTLLDKPSRRTEEVKLDYIGFEVPDRFIVGYGIDYAERYRHLPYIGVVELDDGVTRG